MELNSPLSSTCQWPGLKGCLQPAGRGVKSFPSHQEIFPEPLWGRAVQERAHESPASHSCLVFSS